jgi:hypothetical protein
MQIHITNYLTEVYNFIVGNEGFNQGQPYFDTANPRKATIGYGINLEVSSYLLITLQSMGLFDGKTSAQIATIQQQFASAINSTPDGDVVALKSNLDAVAQQYGLPSFSVTDAQATAAFYVILSGATIGGTVIQGKQQKLDAILGDALPY